ncbi:MAG: endonuclease III [Lachnospiraceae bacterium]|nr:endonuclease III [Lachnospiraceae bacterium]
MEKKTLNRILKLLDRHYGTDIECSLDYDEPWQLLVATIMSAQCTDARVNIVTKNLFSKYRTPKSLGKAKLGDVEKIIRSVGFYHNKAANIIACCAAIDSTYGGRVPDTIEELTSLPGVGRKTANVILGNIYKTPSIVVDTHVKRISFRLGFTDNTDPVKIEEDLMNVLPADHWIRYNHQIINHGRIICRSQRPDCENCFLKECCIKKGIS